MNPYTAENQRTSDKQILASMLAAIHALYYLWELEREEKANPNSSRAFGAKNVFNKYCKEQGYDTSKSDNIAKLILQRHQEDIDKTLLNPSDNAKIKSWSIDSDEITSAENALNHLQDKLYDYSSETYGKAQEKKCRLLTSMALLTLIPLFLGIHISAVPIVIALISFIVIVALFAASLSLSNNTNKKKNDFCSSYFNAIAAKVYKDITISAPSPYVPLDTKLAPYQLPYKYSPFEFEQENPEDGETHVLRRLSIVYQNLYDHKAPPLIYAPQVPQEAPTSRPSSPC